ncbi:hypothetical protein QYE76_000064 [Lolium multiflorum]|uniref:Serpin domain-containing protein n=1 Tax=Lolium multiflorum TaxID=4521 RepID=A0AAD8PHH5_LOLMU|nr:hypothetical protein QYE76_000064 [Lolium multiflorum]
MQSAGGPSSSQGLAALSAGLARRLADEHAKNNLVFSRLSIYTALALVAAGARGATLEEILLVLGTRSRQELDKFVARAAGDALRDWLRRSARRVRVWRLERPIVPAQARLPRGRGPWSTARTRPRRPPSISAATPMEQLG